MTRHTYNPLAPKRSAAQTIVFPRLAQTLACIIPAEAIYEPNYETGRAVRRSIKAAGGEPLGMVGIWEYRSNGPWEQPLISFSVLTINVDDHPLMRCFNWPMMKNAWW